MYIKWFVLPGHNTTIPAVEHTGTVSWWRECLGLSALQHTHYGENHKSSQTWLHAEDLWQWWTGSTLHGCMSETTSHAEDLRQWWTGSTLHRCMSETTSHAEDLRQWWTGSTLHECMSETTSHAEDLRQWWTASTLHGCMSETTSHAEDLRQWWTGSALHGCMSETTSVRILCERSEVFTPWENLIFYGNEQRNDLCNDACEWGWPVAICFFYLFEQRRVLGRFCYLCGGCRCGAGQPCCRTKSVTADIAHTFLGQIHSDLTQL